MNDFITNKELDALKKMIPTTGSIPLSKLVDIYHNSRVDMLKQMEIYTSANLTSQIPEELKRRLTINQSVLTYLTTLELLNNTREGRKALQKIGITIFTSDAKRADTRRKLHD